MNRAQLAARAIDVRAAGPCMIVTDDDRAELAVAITIRGYALDRAHHMLFDPNDREYVEDNDGALQMLARHRVAQAGKV